jgi:LPXTG-motif cell wall-anchored protein
MRRLRTVALVTTCAVALAAAGGAFAQTPTGDAYGGLAGSQQGPAAPADTGGQLPFTGQELGALAVAGAALAGGGLILRRRA